MREKSKMLCGLITKNKKHGRVQEERQRRVGGGWLAPYRFVLLTDFRTHTHLNNGQKLKTNSPSFSFIHWIALYWKKVFVWDGWERVEGNDGVFRSPAD